MKKIIALIAVLFLFTGCMSIKLGSGAKMEVNADRGSTVTLGSKSVSVPVQATVPLSP